MFFKRSLKEFILIFLLSSGICIAKEEPPLFEIDIEHYGKGLIATSLPTTFETAYQPQMVGYWLSNFDMKPIGEPFIVLEVIFYGVDFKAGRNVNTLILKKGESANIFFRLKEKHYKKKNLPQYCFVQVMKIDPSKNYVKLRHWISRHPTSTN